jgi:sugar/nucleoside kinase (ribokinase family)
MPALVPHADTVVCSADFRVPGAAESEASAVDLVNRGVPTVAVTHGGEPIRWWSAGRSGQVAPPVVSALDTVGAGDAFHGAYAYAMAAFPTSAVERRLAFAAAVASLKCCFHGTRSWLRALQEAGIESLG